MRQTGQDLILRNWSPGFVSSSLCDFSYLQGHWQELQSRDLFLRMPTAQPSSQSLPLLIDRPTPFLQGSESPNVASLSMPSGSPVVSSICWSWITGLSWICFQEKKIKRYILGDDICTVTGELGQEKATSRLTFEKKLLGRERLETIRHLSYIQETNGACSRKTCDKQKWERQALCKWPIRVPETHGPALSECRPFPGD